MTLLIQIDLDKVVNSVLLFVAVVSQTGLKLRWHLLYETIIQELAHASVKVPFYPSQAVTFIRVNLQIWLQFLFAASKEVYFS